jgi:hypothetical protein
MAEKGMFSYMTLDDDGMQRLTFRFVLYHDQDVYVCCILRMRFYVTCMATSGPRARTSLINLRIVYLNYLFRTLVSWTHIDHVLWCDRHYGAQQPGFPRII